MIFQQCETIPVAGSVQSLSPKAEPRGHNFPSMASPATCSLHIQASPPNMFCSRAGCESLKARYNCLGLLSYTFCQPATYYSTIRAIKNARCFTRPRPPFGTPTLVLAPQKSAFSLDTFILACVGLIRDSSALFCSEQFYQRKFYSNDFHIKSQKMTIILGIFSFFVSFPFLFFL